MSFCFFFFFFNDTAATEIYTYCHTLSLHDALPISGLASGSTFTAASAWLTDLSPGEDGTAARHSTTALSAGFGLGPLAAGLAGQWLPAPTVVPYLLHAEIGRAHV